MLYDDLRYLVIEYPSPITSNTILKKEDLIEERQIDTISREKTRK